MVTYFPRSFSIRSCIFYSPFCSNIRHSSAVFGGLSSRRLALVRKFLSSVRRLGVDWPPSPAPPRLAPSARGASQPTTTSFVQSSFNTPASAVDGRFLSSLSVLVASIIDTITTSSLFLSLPHPSRAPLSFTHSLSLPVENLATSLFAIFLTTTTTTVWTRSVCQDPVGILYYVQWLVGWLVEQTNLTGDDAGPDRRVDNITEACHRKQKLCILIETLKLYASAVERPTNYRRLLAAGADECVRTRATQSR